MTPRTPSARWALLLVPAALLALAPVAVAAPGEVPYRSYVALGDSYAAGPLIPIQAGQPAGCMRSTRNYPSVVAAGIGVPDVRDVSCSGAQTADLFTAQATQVGTNPPQLDALGPDTALVTLTIGGNDIGFGEIVQECSTRSPLRPRGAACRDFFTADDGTDVLAERIADTAPDVAAALAGIVDRSPDALVALVGYPAILPAQGPGCFPLVPFSPGDVAYLRSTLLALNAMLAEQAAGAGVDYVDTYGPTVGHDVCTLPGRKWFEGLVPTSPAAPVHPNALGMRGMGRAVLADLLAGP